MEREKEIYRKRWRKVDRSSDIERIKESGRNRNI